ncbi:MAG: L,D-transpeptidase family protein [Gaiellaceae bacterium]
MKRAGVGLFLLACALAGAVLAVVLAGPVPASVFATGSTSGTTETTAATTTTTTSSTTTTTAPAGVLADGVTIAGVEVGGLAPEVAFAVVRTAFGAPLVLGFDGHTLQPSPADLGATAYVQGAVDRARKAPPDTEVPLVVRVQGGKVRGYVAKLARRFDRKPVDSRLFLRKLRPFITKGTPGRALDRPAAVEAILEALRASTRFRIGLGARPVRPAVTRTTFGAVIVIRRGANRLYVYDGMRLRRTFGVATGQQRYPTPLGRFSIVVKWRNPWWYPPDSDWAKDEKPIPPGPGNPLGTRWMGISAPGVGIHGTPDPGSIGYSVSHGCIRMEIPHAEWLFGKVSIGTTVFIVSA